jgi:hypothetical protein
MMNDQIDYVQFELAMKKIAELESELASLRTHLAKAQSQVAVLRNDLICGITILTGLNIVWADKS